MSVAVQPIEYYGLPTWRNDVGVSADFGIIRDILDEVKEKFRELISINQGAIEASELLDEVYKECSVENWDGYDAMPVSEAAYFEAKKIIELLPSMMQRPEILAEPTGEIGFEWHKGKGFTFALSVSGKNTITYAGLIGTDKIHGTAYFSGDSLPKIILENINRLYNS